MNRVKLSEVCSKITDGSHNPPRGLSEGDYYMLSSRNIQESGITLNSARLLSESDFEQENKRTDVMPGDVLLTIVGTIGRTVVVPEGFPKFTLQRSVAVLKPKQDVIDSRYLMYTLRSKLKLLESGARGAAQKGIYLNQLKEIKLALPALEEQRKIADKLDIAFHKIDQAIILTEREKTYLNSFFNSQIESIFEKQNQSTKVLIGDVCKIKGGKRLPKGQKLKNTKTPYPYIRVSDFDHQGSVNMNKIQYLNEDTQKQISNYTITDNDVFLSIAGSIGITGIIPSTLNGANLTENACRLIPDEELDKEYLYFFTLTKSFINQAAGATRQTAQPKLAIIRIKNIHFYLPELSTPKIVVNKLKDLTEKIKKLEALVNKKANHLNSLKLSLLDKAFLEGDVK